jgi:hypothetical protein
LDVPGLLSPNIIERRPFRYRDGLLSSRFYDAIRQNPDVLARLSRSPVSDTNGRVDIQPSKCVTKKARIASGTIKFHGKS